MHSGHCFRKDPTHHILRSLELPSTLLLRFSTLKFSLKSNSKELASQGMFEWSRVFIASYQLHSTAGNQGEVESPLAGEMRLQSDFEVGLIFLWAVINTNVIVS